MIGKGLLSFVTFIMGVGFWTLPVQAAPECRAVKLPDGTSTQMCKGADGRWMQTDSTPSDSSTAFPPDFHGKVSYAGSYTGKIFVAGRGPRSLNINELLRSATSGKTTEMGGSFTLELEYDGSTVKGSYKGTGAIDPGSFSGTRSGDVCTFLDRNGKWSGHCGRDGFNVNFATYQGVSPKVNATITASATGVQDNAKRDALQKQCDAGKSTACVALDQLPK